MSKSVLLKSSIAKKYWMALTGLFLCVFLVGHLAGNLQLFMHGEEGKRAFNEYAYFMQHNPFIKILSWVTYISILFHAIDGFLLAFQNKKARPVNYAYNKPSANSSWASRNMALLGSVILIFIVTHMANFWWKMKYADKPLPLHTYVIYPPMTQNPAGDTVYYTVTKQPLPKDASSIVKDGDKIHLNVKAMEEQIQQAKQMAIMSGQPFDESAYKNMNKNPELAQGYKDLHSLVYSFFGHDKTKWGFPKNDYALYFVIAYVLSMFVLGFHLSHGFASAFQSLGMRHPAYTKAIKIFGVAAAWIISMAFAAIPVYIYLTK